MFQANFTSFSTSVKTLFSEMRSLPTSPMQVSFQTMMRHRQTTVHTVYTQLCIALWIIRGFTAADGPLCVFFVTGHPNLPRITRWSDKFNPTAQYDPISAADLLKLSKLTKRKPATIRLRVKRGANGTRTRNPLLAKQVRYQLRHSPVGGTQSSTVSVTDVHRSALSERSTRICRTAMPTATTDPTATQQVTHFFMMILRFRSPADGGPRWARTTDLSLIRTAL